jgi:hypothetical protein
MITEKEAKTKWCPHTQVVVEQGVMSDNRLPGTGEPTGLPVCIGSACMMWRRESTLPSPLRVHPDAVAEFWQGWAVTDAQPDDDGHVEISEVRPLGYCGLAGRPGQ